MTDKDAAPTDGGNDSSNDMRHEDADDNVNEEWQVQRDEEKHLGDDAYRSKDYAAAVAHYTSALSLDPTNGTLLSNRSAAYLQQGYKSAALHDAVACVATNTTGVKGLSRQGAALQALGRYRAALVVWQSILHEYDATHAVALAGRDVCEQQVQIENERQKRKDDQNEDNPIETSNPPELSIAEASEPAVEEKEEDDLDDFFNDVEDAAVAVVQEKLTAALPVPTEAVRNHKRELGSTAEQIERILPSANYIWYNLNPFHVLDLPHTADKDEISRRFKALSLLLHPDKNTTSGLPPDRLQLAYDQVLMAKAALLNDEDKLKHTRDLVEEGMRQGMSEHQEATAATNASSLPLEDYQRKAVQRLFADIEHSRRQVAERERSFHQREQAAEDAVVTKERNERTFDKQWKKEERVDKRIGDWRDFQKKKKKTE